MRERSAHWVLELLRVLNMAAEARVLVTASAQELHSIWRFGWPTVAFETAVVS
jgi:hypothetical protein